MVSKSYSIVVKEHVVITPNIQIQFDPYLWDWNWMLATICNFTYGGNSKISLDTEDGNPVLLVSIPEAEDGALDSLEIHLRAKANGEDDEAEDVYSEW